MYNNRHVYLITMKQRRYAHGVYTPLVCIRVRVRMYTSQENVKDVCSLREILSLEDRIDDASEVRIN